MDQVIVDRIHHLETAIDTNLHARHMGLYKVFGTDRDPECIDLISDMVASSPQLTVVLNYSNRWIERYQEALKKRFNDSSKHTIFYFVYPEGQAIHLLAYKQDYTLDELKGRLIRTYRQIESLRGPETSLDYRGHFFFNTHHIVLGQDLAAITPYYISREKRPTPCLLVRRALEWEGEDYFTQLNDDISSLQSFSHDVGSWLGEQSKVAKELVARDA